MTYVCSVFILICSLSQCSSLCLSQFIYSFSCRCSIHITATRAHCRHLANTIELVLPLAHPSPQPKRQIDQFSHFCTAHGRKSLYFTMGAPFPQNCPYPWGIWTPCNTWFIEHIRAYNLNEVQPFLHRWPQSVPTLYNGTPVSRSILLPPMGDLDRRLIHGSLSPPESSTKTASRSVQLFLQGSLVWQTDRQTRYLVGNNRPHLHM